MKIAIGSGHAGFELKEEVKKTAYLLFLLATSFIFSQQNKKDELYIRRFAEIAVNEMILYKIPASIKLGQGLLETAEGQSELAKNANNHFGIKCKETWTGETYRYTDDAYMECFRKYADAKDSYRDHSIFLTTRKHYASLFKLELTDYKAWAYGLKKAGYATNPKYPQILIGKIEKYKLYEFDSLEPKQVYEKLDELYPTTKQEIPYEEPKQEEANIKKQEEVFKVQEKELSTSKNELTEEDLRPKDIRSRIKYHKNKGLKYIIVRKGETIKKISEWYGISISELKNYNDLENIKFLKEEQFLFLEHKLKKGSERYHKVIFEETMYIISQKEGIKLEELYRRNRMSYAEEPKPGELLNLKGVRKRK